MYQRSPYLNFTHTHTHKSRGFPIMSRTSNMNKINEVLNVSGYKRNHEMSDQKGVDKTRTKRRRLNKPNDAKLDTRSTFMSNLAKQDGSGCKNLLNSLKRDKRRRERIQKNSENDLRLTDDSNNLSIKNMEEMHFNEINIKKELNDDKKKLNEQIKRLSSIPDVFIQNEGDEMINMSALYDNIKQMKDTIGELEEYLRLTNNNHQFSGITENESINYEEFRKDSNHLKTTYEECMSNLNMVLERTNSINSHLYTLIKLQSEKHTGVRKMKTLLQNVNEHLDRVVVSEKRKQDWLVTLTKHERAFWCPTLSGGVSKPTYTLQAEAIRVAKIERALKKKLELEKKGEKDKPNDGSTTEPVPLELELACDVNTPILNNTPEHRKPLTKARWAAKTNIRNKGQ